MNKITLIALKGVGLAMAVAVIVLGILKSVTLQTQVDLLAVGLFAIGLALLSKE